MCHDTQLLRWNQAPPSPGRSHQTTKPHPRAVRIPQATPSESREASFPENGVPARKLKDILLERDLEVIVRTSGPIFMFLCTLAQADRYMIPPNIYVRTPPSMTIASRLQPSVTYLPLHLYTDFNTYAYSSHTSHVPSFLSCRCRALHFLGIFNGWPLGFSFAAISARGPLRLPIYWFACPPLNDILTFASISHT